MRLPTSASSTPPATAATSLTERRKAATRMDIARAAAGLFVRHGLRATRAEDIAQAAGIAPRTFYRYFATKEEAVAPLYAAGAERWAVAVREAPAELSLPQALEHGVRHTLTPGVGVSASSWEWVRTLIRLADASPALGKVWAEVCHTSERTLAEVVRERVTGRGAGPGAGDTAARAAGRVTGRDDNVAEGEGRGGDGAADFGASPAGAGAGAGAGAAAGSRAGSGSGSRAGSGSGSRAGSGSGSRAGSGPGSGGETRGVAASDAEASGVEVPGAVPAGLRFAAAAASAAVRTAVEGWAAGDAAAGGPEGPAAVALRNLDALRDFPWETVVDRREA